jgi:uncharacterized membrane protein
MTMTINPASSSSIDQAASPAWFDLLQRGSVIGSTILIGLAAGFFFTYQISVTRGLAIVDDQAYVESFQAINATIRNAWFGIVFFGSIPMLCATLALQWNNARLGRTLVATSLVLYLATLAITAIGNIRLNDELAVVTGRTPSVLAAARADFEATWNTLNLARTLTCVGALVAIAAVSRLRDVTQ